MLEQQDLVDLATKHEINDLKTALDDSNKERLTLKNEIEGVQAEHSALLLKLQDTTEQLETNKVEARLESNNNHHDQEMISRCEELKHQLLVKEEEMSNLREKLSDEDEMHQLLEQRDGMIANLRSGLEKSFLKKDDLEKITQELVERNNKLVQDLERKCIELNDAENKQIHLQLESVDAKIMIEQTSAEKSKINQLNSSLIEENEKLASEFSRDNAANCATDEISVIIEKNSALTKENADLSEKIVLLNDEIEVFQTSNQNKSHVDRLSKLEEETNALLRKNVEFSNETHALQEENNGLQKKIASLSEEYERNSGLIYDQNMKIEDLKQKNEHHEQEKNALADDIVQLKNNESYMLECHANELKIIENQLVLSKEENTQFSTVLADLNNKIGQLTAVNAELSEKLSQLQESSFKISMENNSFDAPKQESVKSSIDNVSNDRITILERELFDVRNSLTDTRDELEMAANKYRDLEEGSQEVVTSQTSENPRTEFNDLKDQLSAATIENTGLSMKLSKLTDDHSYLVTENAELSKNLEELKESCDCKLLELKNEVEFLNKQVSTHKEEIISLQTEKSNAEISLTGAKDELDKLLENASNVAENHAIEIENINGLIIAAKSEQSRLAASVSQMTKDNEKFKFSNSELLEKLDNFEAIASKTNSAIHEKLTQTDPHEIVDITNEQSINNGDRINSLENKISSQEKELDGRKKECEHWAKKYSDILQIETNEFLTLELESKVATLESECLSKDEALRNMECEMGTLADAIADKDSQLSSENVRIELEFEEKLVNAEKRYNDLNRRLSQELKAKISLQNDCDELMASLQKKERTVKEKDEQYQTIISQLKDQLRDRENEIDEKVMEIKECVKYIEDYEEEKKGLHDREALNSEQMNQLKSDIIAMTSQRDDCLQTISELQSCLKELSSCKSRLDNAADEVKNQKNEILTLTSALTDERNASSKLMSEITEFKNRIFSIEAERDSNFKTLSELEVKLIEKTRKHDELSTELENKNSLITQYQSQITLITAECDSVGDVQSEAMELKNRIFSIEAERESHLKSLSELKGKLVDQTRSHNELFSELDNKKSQITEYQSQIALLTAERDSVQEAQSDFSSKLSEKTQFCDQLGSDLENREKLITDYQSQIYLITAERDSNCKNFADIEKKLEEQTRLYSQLLSESKEKDCLVDKYDALSKQLTEAQLNFENKSQELSKASEQLSELQRANSHFRSQKKALENQIEDLQKSILEYEMMKSSYIQLKSSFDVLSHEKNLLKLAKEGVENDLHERIKYYDSSINNDMAKYRQLEEKFKLSEEHMKKEMESLQQEKLNVTKALEDQVFLLTSECSKLNKQNEEFNKQLSNALHSVSVITAKEENSSSMLRDKDGKCTNLEKQIVSAT